MHFFTAFALSATKRYGKSLLSIFYLYKESARRELKPVLPGYARAQPVFVSLNNKNMENCSYSKPFLVKGVKKVVFIMKLTLLLFFVTLLQAFGAEPSYSQTARMTIRENRIALTRLFSLIEKQSEFLFFYVDKDVRPVSVSVNVKDKPIDEVLSEALSGTNLTYTIHDRHINIVSKERTGTLQQTGRTVSGVVTDKSGLPVIGANIVDKETGTGAITDLDGKFTLRTGERAVLLVSYIGYVAQEIEVSGRSFVPVVLEEDNQRLDEVVVVGFGTQKKVNLTGAVANVDNKLIQDRPITSVSAGLQGLLSGVTVTQRSGQPGMDEGTIRVRGVGTFNNADPMVLVDGVESSMNAIDPNDIESISVLKDAASAAIYGSKAANGVVLITTKRGKKGKATVSYAANFGWQSPTELPEYCHSADYAVLTNEARAYAGKAPMYTDEEIRKFRDGSAPYDYPDTDWQDLLYTGSGFQHSHNINVSSGNDQVRYMTSVGYQGQRGIIRNAGKKQYNVRVNIDANPVERVETSVSISYSNITLEEPTNPYVGGMAQVFRQVNMISPMVPYKKADGTYGTIGDGNPIAWQDLDATTDKKRNRLLAIGSVKYAIIEGLSVKGQASYNTYTEDSNEFIKDIQYNPNKYHGPNKMTQNDTFEHTVTGDVMLEYKNTSGLHHLDVLAGFHSELYNYKLTMAYRQNFPSNELGDLNAGATAGAKAEGYTRELAMMSWLGRVNYDYAGRYLFEANVRYDGSSRFAAGNRWGVFPSFSAGWRISEEAFFENFREVWNNLKVRASWGKLGNQVTSVGGELTDIEYYPTIPTINLGANYPMGGTIASGGYTKYAKNKDLKWEETVSWGIGADLSLVNRVNVSLDYYQKETSGILMEVPTPSTFGLQRFIDNVGKVRNRGVELSVQYNDRFGKVGFSFGGNVAYNKNEILDLGGVDQIIDEKTVKKVGYAMNSFYGYETAGLYQSEAEIAAWPEYKITGQQVMPGDIRYVNQNGDTVIDENDRVVLDSSDPQVTFGFNLGVQYAGFDLLAFFQGAAKVKGYMDIEAIGSINGDDGKPASLWLDRWTPGNPGARYPRVCETLSGASMPSTVSSFWLQNANYLRLKNLQFGYTFPARWLQPLSVSRLRVYYSAQNILTFTRFLKGWDPEAPAGRGDYYPQTQVHAVGLNLTF